MWQVAGTYGRAWRAAWAAEGVSTVLFLQRGDRVRHVCMCQNASNCTLQIYVVYDASVTPNGTE